MPGKLPLRISWAGPQHPIYGIRRENIVARLTEGNWSTKAVVRQRGDTTLYIWIERAGVEEDPDRRTGRFRVRVEALAGSLPDQAGDSDFEVLAAALACANGEDGGWLAQETRPAAPEDYPADEAAGAVVIVGEARRPRRQTEEGGRK
jgi:hypothetical protein